jgi:S-formylglutathione hydrolase FrmB
VLQFFSKSKLNQSIKVPPTSTITSNSLYTTENNDDHMDIDPVDFSNPNVVQNSSSISPDLFANEDSVENSNIEVASSTSSANNNKYFSIDKLEREQEYKDFLFAQKLQEKFNLESEMVDKNDRPNITYQFRDSTKTSKGIIKRKSSVQKKRSHTASSQPTLREAYRRAANKNSQ